MIRKNLQIRAFYESHTHTHTHTHTYIYIYIYRIRNKLLFGGNILSKPALINLHAVKWFQVLLRLKKYFQYESFFCT